MLILAVAVTLAMPLGLAYWLWASRASTRAESAARVVGGASLLGVMTMGAPLGILGIYTPWLLWLLMILAIGRHAWRNRTAPLLDTRGWRPLARLLAALAPPALFCFVLMRMLAARRVPPNPVPMRFPLRSGRYVIGHGGSNAFLNAHARVKAQRFALDIGKVGRLGFRAAGIAPTDLHRYFVFDDPVFAPCDGEVLVAVDQFDDLTPPSSDTEHLAGNHVVIACRDESVILAHLRRGSVLVSAGASVTTDTIVGAVGNSGNTSEPHLHIHAVRGRVSVWKELASRGEPVALLFDGRFLVRNDIVTMP
jgi:hypothetical protein